MLDPQIYYDVEGRRQFRWRMLVLMLGVLLVLLLVRSWTSQGAALSKPTPTRLPGGVLGSPAPSPTITPIPAILFTPFVTFSAIPPTYQPPTHTSTPTITATATQTPAAPTVTPSASRVTCQGYGHRSGKEWVVAGCDTLERISQATGIRLEALLAANPQIKDPDLIFPGQLIRLPNP